MEENEQKVSNGYVHVPRWLATALFGVAVALLSAYLGVIVNSITADVLALEDKTKELEDRSRFIETSVGVINEKLSNIEENQEKTDQKLDTILQKLKK